MFSKASTYLLWLASATVLFFSTATAELKSIDIPGQVSAIAPANVVSSRTAWSVDRVRPGDQVHLAVVADIQKGFHINADPGQLRPSGDFKPVPTRIRVQQVPAGFIIGPARFPRAHPVQVAYADDDLMFFDGRLVVTLPIRLDENVPTGRQRVVLEFSYQACDDQTCLFPKKTLLETQIPVVEAAEKVAAVNRDIFSGFEAAPATAASSPVSFDLFGWRFSLNAASALGMSLLLVTSAFGGMLLNFTPCVLPLVPIKIISLSNAAREDRKRSVMLGIFMFLGVLAFWLVLGLMIAMVSGFTATNQLFQYPPFTIAVGVIIAVMAMGMCGLFHTRLPNFLYMINPDEESLPGSFIMGILTAVLSTPCTAPFMGAAAAWAATRPPAVTLSTFAAIGTGMAMPYLVLSALPGMIKKLPKTGPGSILLKEIMGLLMMAAAAYFIGGGISAFYAHPPDPPSKLYWWAVVSFCAAAGAWLTFKTFRITTSKGVRTVFALIGLLMVAGAAFGGLRLTDKGPVDWINYTPQRLGAALGEKKAVVMVFTAEWCLNCKALEQSVLHSRDIAELFADGRVVPIKVDITGKNAAGKAKLREVGSLTIPLLVVMAPDGRTVFKNDFYTVDQVLEAVGKALQPKPTRFE